jgi:hypothetical protein
MIRASLIAASLALWGTGAIAQPSEGQGVIIDCPVTDLVMSTDRALFTCADGFSDTPGLNDQAELPYENSDDNRWLADRAVALMLSAPRDESDRPILRFNIMYLGSGRAGRIMDVRAAWSNDANTIGRLDARISPRGLRDAARQPGRRDAPSTSTARTPTDGQGLVMACHLTEVALLSDRARFSCADGFNSGWYSLNDQIDLRYSMDSENQWMTERAIELIASAPRDSADRPILHFNIMYRGAGTQGYAMDVRTQY